MNPKQNDVSEVSDPVLRVLVIEDDEGEFDLVRELLNDKADVLHFEWRPTLADGIEALAAKNVDVILLDLFLPDGRGLESFDRVKEKFPAMPIVILSGLDDESSAVEAVRRGAQDYLVKGQADGRTLWRVLRYAIQRSARQNDPNATDLLDSVTGLYNRRGFIALSDLPLHQARRAAQPLFVCLGVVNGWDGIVARYGASEGEHALLTVAQILQESFRKTDLIAHLGRGSFIILTSHQGDYSPKALLSRIKTNQTYYNAQFNHYRTSLSVGVLPVDTAQTITPQDLCEKAEAALASYKTKQGGFLSTEREPIPGATDH